MAHHFLKLAAALAITTTIAAPAGAEVLAECGASAGKARYGEPGAAWTDDRISGGSFTFTLDAKGNANVLFRDTRGGTVDAAADGAQVALVYASPNRREFTIIVAYDTGAVETYNVVVEPGGSRQLLWTLNRAAWLGAAKVGSYVAFCPK